MDAISACSISSRARRWQTGLVTLFAKITMRLRISEDIIEKLQNPVMLAGWPGMGQVGSIAVQYIRSGLSAKEFAHIDMSDELMAPSVHIKDGLVLRSELPVTRFYYSQSPDVIFVESENQLNGASALSLMRGVLDFARSLGVSTIYTAASFAMPVTCNHEIEVYGAANDPVLRDRLLPMGAAILEEGEIAGMNGVLLGFTNGYDIPAACLMASMPQYARRLPNPKSSRALIEFFQRVLGFEIDLTGLNKEVKKLDLMMSEIEQRIQKVVTMMNEPDVPFSKEDVSIFEKKEKKSPEKAMQKIEQMFCELAKDRSRDKATRLKQELDKWDLYDLYEDRFLDLFRSEEDDESS